MFTNSASNPRVRLSSLTNTQGLPSHRLTISPSQSSSTHVPSAYFSTSEVTHEACNRHRICRLYRHRLGRCEARYLFAGRHGEGASSRPAPSCRCDRGMGGFAATTLPGPARCACAWRLPRARSSMRCRSTTFWCSSRSIRPRWPSTAQAFTPSQRQGRPHGRRTALELLLRHRDKLKALTPRGVRRCARWSGWSNSAGGWWRQERITNRLTDALKQYFPQVLDWFEDKDTLAFCDFLSRWPTLKQLQRARKATLQTFFYLGPY